MSIENMSNEILLSELISAKDFLIKLEVKASFTDTERDINEYNNSKDALNKFSREAIVEILERMKK